MPEAPGASNPATPGFSSAVWEEAGWLGCEVSVELPVHGFTVRDLSVDEPTLETVFINLTGKDLRE